MKNYKAVGNDNIAKEMIEACGDIGIEKVCQLATEVYDKGIIPQRMKKSILSPSLRKEISFNAVITD